MTVAALYLVFSAMLFSIGVFGVLIRRNAIVIFMCIELMLNAANLLFAALSRQYGTADAQGYVLFVMAVAAAEAAVGLAIILTLFRNYYSVQASEACTLRG